MDNDVNYRNIIDELPVPNFNRVPGIILIFAGFIVLFVAILYKTIIGAAIITFLYCIFFGFRLMTDNRGIIFDFDNKLIKQYEFMIGIDKIKFGIWEKMLKCKLIVLDIKRTKYSVAYPIFSLNKSPLQYNETYRIGVSYKNSEKFDLLIHFKDYQTALNHGLWLAEKWNVPLENRVERS